MIFSAALTVVPGCRVGLPAQAPSASQASRDAAGSADEASRLVWFPASIENPLGNVIVVHGLNINPDAMNAWIDKLNSAGLHALRVTLAGHEQDPALKHSGSAKAWLEDFGRAYASAKSKYPELPLYCLGFSLGGLLSVAYLDLHPETEFKGIALLAPALEPTRKVFFLRLISWLRFFKLSLPGIGLRKYIRHDSASFSAYHGLIELSDRAQELEHGAALNRMPILVALSLKDELVSSPRTKGWMRRNHISDWRMIEISPEPRVKKTFYHMLLDRDGLGLKEWERLSAAVLEFFAISPQKQAPSPAGS